MTTVSAEQPKQHENEIKSLQALFLGKKKPVQQKQPDPSTVKTERVWFKAHGRGDNRAHPEDTYSPWVYVLFNEPPLSFSYLQTIIMIAFISFCTCSVFTPSQSLLHVLFVELVAAWIVTARLLIIYPEPPFVIK